MLTCISHQRQYWQNEKKNPRFFIGDIWKKANISGEIPGKDIKTPK
ncbi:MAG: hypothetical protein H7Z13_20265 [Ferruginibacter sp.]|nr:hypothetical protein [Ferruginibacter sp.]